MSFNSKYSGQQVENLLDQVANGNAGGGEVQKTTEAEILAMGFTKGNLTSVDITEGEQIEAPEVEYATKGYVDQSIKDAIGSGGGGGDISVDGYIPLSRDFNDDFNDDFAR